MKAEIFIDNLKCGGCANTITKAIKELEGIVAVKVDKERDLVEIEITENFNPVYAVEGHEMAELSALAGLTTI